MGACWYSHAPVVDTGDSTGLPARLRATAAQWVAILRSMWQSGVRIVPALDLVAELARRFGRLNGSVLVGHIAYRTFMWLIPLLLVAIGLLGYGAAQGIDMVQYGHDVGLDEELLETTSEQTGSVGINIVLVALFGLVLATRSLLRAMFFVYAQAWEVKPRLPRRSMRAIGMTIVGAVVMLLVTALTNALAGNGPLLFVGAALVGMAVTAVVLLVMSWFLPHRATTILQLIPGIVMAVIGVVLISLIGGLYFPQRLSSASETYGTIGFTLVFLFFLWLWAYLLVGSAFVNAVWCDHEEILHGRPWVAAPELLPAWVRRWLPRSLGGGRDRDGLPASRSESPSGSRPDPTDPHSGRRPGA